MRWKEFIKVYEHWDEPAPYYVQWVVWCWRKPIWIGLPLVILTPLFIIIDIIYIVGYGLTIWAKRR